VLPVVVFHEGGDARLDIPLPLPAAAALPDGG